MPVPEQPETTSAADGVRDAIAVNLKRWRLIRGHSIRELAQRAAVSPALLSQLERGAANCTIDVLSRIAAALGVSFADLTWRSVAEPQLVRFGDGETVIDADARIRTLFDSTDRRRFEVSIGTIGPGGENSRATHGIGSVEYVYVVDGAVEILSDRWRFALERGDALKFSGEDVHRYRAGSRGAEVLTLVSSTDEGSIIDVLGHAER